MLHIFTESAAEARIHFHNVWLATLVLPVEPLSMEPSVMQCSNCGEFCAVSTTTAGEHYCIGSSGCPAYDGTDLKQVTTVMTRKAEP